MLVDKIQTVGFQMRRVNLEFKKLCKNVNMDFSDFNLEGYESNFCLNHQGTKEGGPMEAATHTQNI